MQEGASIQELPVMSSASPAVSEAKHMPSKPAKQEDGKGESGGGAVPNVDADALNRLIAMGGPAGRLPPAKLSAVQSALYGFGPLACYTSDLHLLS